MKHKRKNKLSRVSPKKKTTISFRKYLHISIIGKIPQNINRRNGKLLRLNKDPYKILIKNLINRKYRDLGNY